MRDPYLFDEIDVMKNKLGIKDVEKLRDAEGDIVPIKLMDVDELCKGKFDFNLLKSINGHLFGDIYDWAGKVRTINIEKPEDVLSGKSVSYCDYSLIEKEAKNVIREINEVEWNKLNKNEIAENLSKLTSRLWQIHPFREGNTRTTISFMKNFAESKGISIDIELLKNNIRYVRTSLVMASLGKYAEYEHLNRILKDAIVEVKDVNIKEKQISNDKSNILKIKDKIVEMYSNELPSIKYITKETATFIYNLNREKDHIHTIKEIKELHKESGKKLENNNDNMAEESLEEINLVESLEEFEALSGVVADINQANLKLLNKQIRNDMESNQLSKGAIEYGE